MSTQIFSTSPSSGLVAKTPSTNGRWPEGPSNLLKNTTVRSFVREGGSLVHARFFVLFFALFCALFFCSWLLVFGCQLVFAGFAPFFVLFFALFCALFFVPGCQLVFAGFAPFSVLFFALFCALFCALFFVLVSLSFFVLLFFCGFCPIFEQHTNDPNCAFY